MKKLLVTGGAGYIGSHCCVALIDAGYEVVALDNLCVGKPDVIPRASSAAGRSIPFHELDIRDGECLRALFLRYKLDGVMHFAGLKSVGESVQKPLEYYDKNVVGTMALLQAMTEFDVRTIVFSSSATVYGDASSSPIGESAALLPTNPYGRTKQMVERILFDLAAADPAWRVGLLRYFNPVGAHSSGLIGEDPEGIPNNLMPYVAGVAEGRYERLTVFGNDYLTPDGTGVRDFVHVMDLVEAHVAALEYLSQNAGAYAWNIGTGRGHSVLELVQMFERVSGVRIPYVFGERRPGDVASVFADASAAERDLAWSAKRGLREMCDDAWRWIRSRHRNSN
jgi:UDP-glucose 4-epimerase